MITSLVKKFPTFCTTLMLVTVFTTAATFQNHCVTFRNKQVFIGEELLAPRPYPSASYITRIITGTRAHKLVRLRHMETKE